MWTSVKLTEDIYTYTHTHTENMGSKSQVSGYHQICIAAKAWTIHPKEKKDQNISALGRIYLERLGSEQMLCSCFLKESHDLPVVPTSKVSRALLPAHETELQVPNMRVSAPAVPPELHWATLTEKQVKIAKLLSSQDTALQAQMWTTWSESEQLLWSK